MSENQNQNQNETQTTADALAAGVVGCQLSFCWLGETKTIDETDNAEAAGLFGADSESFRACKRILSRTKPEIRALALKRNEIRRYWLSVTLPYLRGLRLLPLAAVAEVERELTRHAAELRELAAGLVDIHAELLEDARARLGRLFNAGDYPDTLADCFRVSFGFPSVRPPDYLATLAPDVFQREAERVAAQFNRAAELAETALASEFGSMLERITETLRGTDTDGRPRVFRDSMVGNLRDFFQRFRFLRVGSGAELAALVDHAEQLTRGISPQLLRDDSAARALFVDQVARIENQLTAAVIPAGRRIRPAVAATSTTDTPAEAEAVANVAPAAAEPKPATPDTPAEAVASVAPVATDPPAVANPARFVRRIRPAAAAVA